MEFDKLRIGPRRVVESLEKDNESEINTFLYLEQTENTKDNTAEETEI